MAAVMNFRFLYKWLLVSGEIIGQTFARSVCRSSCRRWNLAGSLNHEPLKIDFKSVMQVFQHWQCLLLADGRRTHPSHRSKASQRIYWSLQSMICSWCVQVRRSAKFTKEAIERHRNPSQSKLIWIQSFFVAFTSWCVENRGRIAWNAFHLHVLMAGSIWKIRTQSPSCREVESWQCYLNIFLFRGSLPLKSRCKEHATRRLGPEEALWTCAIRRNGGQEQTWRQTSVLARLRFLQGDISMPGSPFPDVYLLH